MVIYVDVLFLLNLFYDFLILMTVDITLKRRMKLRRIIIGSIFGGLSIFIIFFKINKIILFLLKILLGLIMVIITYRFKNIKYTSENIVYLFMVSVIMGGFLYYLKLEFTNANYILLIIIAPIILGIYIFEQKKLKLKINLKRNVKIILKNNKLLELEGFIDTGNRLKDPITKKNIILINKKRLDGIYNIRSPIYVPINTVNKKGILECITIKDLIIDNRHYHNYLLGLSDYLKGNVECLLNQSLLEEEI